MEDSLSMPELMATLKSYRDMRFNERKFAAAIQGVDIGDADDDKLEEIKRRAEIRARGGDPDANDIVAFIGNENEAGLGSGLSYEVW